MGDKYKKGHGKKFEPIPYEPYNPEDFSNNFDLDMIKQESDDE